jgi:hypothetical protein
MQASLATANVKVQFTGAGFTIAPDQTLHWGYKPPNE